MRMRPINILNKYLLKDCYFDGRLSMRENSTLQNHLK